MESKRAQAAMEFLMTYGWAILVVLIVIGALAYFGMFNLNIFFQERCTFQTGFQCDDAILQLGPNGNTANITILMQNSMGEDIKITNLTFKTTTGTNCSGYNGATDQLFDDSPMTLNQGEMVKISTANSTVGFCPLSSIDDGAKPDKTFKFTVTGKYIDSSSGFSHPISGEVLVKAQAAP